MFTGIVTEIGTITRSSPSGGGVRLTVNATQTAKDLHVNDSISVNGVCQTVISLRGDSFDVEAVEETLRKTTLGDLRAGAAVNLELPVRLNDMLGGHLVLGHIDCVGTVREIADRESSRLITVVFPGEFTRYIVPVGSIAVDGISLTVAALSGNTFTISIIPHTLEKTTISRAKAGTKVNLEFDILGKYIERLLPGKNVPDGTLNAQKLKEWGYDVS